MREQGPQASLARGRPRRHMGTTNTRLSRCFTWVTSQQDLLTVHGGGDA